MKKPASTSRTSPAPATAKPKDSKAKKQDKVVRNPPFTTKWGITSPEFGSAGSGGAEYEPGPEAD